MNSHCKWKWNFFFFFLASLSVNNVCATYCHSKSKKMISLSTNQFPVLGRKPHIVLQRVIEKIWRYDTRWKQKQVCFHSRFNKIAIRRFCFIVIISLLSLFIFLKKQHQHYVCFIFIVSKIVRKTTKTISICILLIFINTYINTVQVLSTPVSAQCTSGVQQLKPL